MGAFQTRRGVKSSKLLSWMCQYVATLSGWSSARGAGATIRRTFPGGEQTQAS